MDIHTAELENRISAMQAELLGLQQQLNAARGNHPAQIQLPGLPQQEGFISRTWRGFRAAFLAGIAMLRKGWHKLKQWASTAWTITKSVAVIAWESTKIAAIVVWGVTKMVANRVWSKIKSVSLRVWSSVRPAAEAVWAKTKGIAFRAWMFTMVVAIVVFEKAVSVSAWLAQKMQQVVEVTTQAVNRLAEFLGRMLAHIIVLGVWAFFQVRTVYETARETVRDELLLDRERTTERPMQAAA